MSTSFFRRLTKRFFIVVNVFAAILFLLGCYGYLFNPKLLWPIGFLTLTAFYFFLLLLAFIFFWLFTKPVFALISLAAILLAYKPMTNIVPLRFTNSFSKAKQQDNIRVMSWNVAQFNTLDNKKHPQLQNQMLALINEYQPDIACFQEMVAEDSAVTDHGHMDAFLQKLNFSNYHYSYNRQYFGL